MTIKTCKYNVNKMFYHIICPSLLRHSHQLKINLSNKQYSDFFKTKT